MLPKPDNIFSITPSDSEKIAQTQYIMVTAEGDVAVETTQGTQGVLPGLVPGVQYAIAAQKVLATGTTATGIVGLA
jgi:uncharacterized protein (AIM24 family)